MSEVKWTDDQKRAIDWDNGAVIVSAAAGSGKTAVLIEHVMQLVMNPEKGIKADEIVVSTFTQKAADELRIRLDKALTAALEKEPDNKYLQEQSLRLKDAAISTISSFFLKILRQNSSLVDLSPDFSMLDDAEGKLIFSKSLTAVLERFYETAEEEEKDLIYDWYGGENDDTLRSLVEKLYYFSRNLISPDEYFDKWLEFYENSENAEAESKKLLEKHIGGYVAEMKRLTEEFSLGAAGTPAEDTAKCGEEKVKIWEEFDPEISTLAEAAAKAEEIEWPPTPRKNAKTGFDSSDTIQYKKQLNKLFTQIAKDDSFSAFLQIPMERKACAKPLSILISLEKALEKEYSERKREKNKIDFSDLESMTIKLLRDEKGEPTPAAKELAGSISVIIVDEFQDSNDVQYEIFRLISRNKKNLYFVGDIKQSIYSFRGANPLVFSSLTKDPDFTVINLKCNFRSNSSVIDSVNGIFRGTMTEEVGDVEYDEDCALVQGAAYEETAENKTELIIYKGENADSARLMESAGIAARINDMIRSGFKVTDKGSKRPCRYGDFAILLRDYASSAHYYKDALYEAGIPFDAKEEGSFTDFAEVKLTISLLKIIDNPYLDKELAQILMRPPYMFSAQEIAEVKLAGGKRRKNLYTGLTMLSGASPKISAFLNELEGYREFAANNTVEQLMRKIYDESPFVTAINASPDGRRRDANIKLLIRHAAAFSENGSGSLFDFITTMENMANKKIRLEYERPGDKSRNCVKIMTIHKSKGLEFPVCFVANLPKAYSTKESKKLALNRSKGIGMYVIDSKNMLEIPTTSYSDVAAENKRLAISEEMRLLYVAATRAREKLIFTATAYPRAGSGMFLGWIENSAAMREGLIARTEIEEEEEAYELSETAQKEEAEAVIKPFAEYAYRRFSELPAKVTATQIGVKSSQAFSDRGSGFEKFLRSPSFLKEGEEKKLSGKKKGDAYHKVMELLDFGAGAGSAGKQLDGLLERGKITEAERLSVADGDIDAFLGSGICERAAKSGNIRREFPIFCECSPKLWGIGELPEKEEKPFIQGIADMFFTENDEIVLVDYKTNKNTTPEQLTEEYRGQLMIYSKALTEATGMRVKECLLYAFSLGREIKVEV